jgi:hypothetical protein
VLGARQAGLRGGDLELTLAHVIQVLRGPHDHVHERPDEREDRRGGGAPDQHGVLQAPPGVRVRPVDQRQPQDDDEEQQQVDGEVQPAVVDAEHGDDPHRRRECTWQMRADGGP